MKLWSDSFTDGQPVPGAFAFAVPHPEDHVALSDNRNPHLAWRDLPKGTRSLALICVDPDAPTRPDDVNREGRTVPRDLPRTDFYHWALVDLPADADPIAEGEFADGVTPKGKDGPAGPRGTRQGLNDYTGWFAGDEDMAGEYFGYDGPAPPWNDERVHSYHFTLYALSVDTLDLPENFTGQDVVQAIDGKVLGTASIVGTYTLNPSLR